MGRTKPFSKLSSYIPCNTLCQISFYPLAPLTHRNWISFHDSTRLQSFIYLFVFSTRLRVSQDQELILFFSVICRDSGHTGFIGHNGCRQKVRTTGDWEIVGVNPVPILKRSHYEFSFYFDFPDPTSKDRGVTWQEMSTGVKSWALNTCWSGVNHCGPFLSPSRALSLH